MSCSNVLKGVQCAVVSGFGPIAGGLNALTLKISLHEKKWNQTGGISGIPMIGAMLMSIVRRGTGQLRMSWPSGSPNASAG